MTRPADQRQRLRGNRAMCAECRHLFGSVAAFDRHLRPIAEQRRGVVACLSVAEFTAPTGKRSRPRLEWSERRELWVSKRDERDHGRGQARDAIDREDA